MLAGTLFGASLTLATAWLTGRGLWSRAEWPLQFALGAAVLAHLVFALGWLGALHAGAFAGLAAALAAFSVWRAGWCAEAGAAWPRPSACWLFFLPLVAFLLVHATGPAVQPDEITYHLGLVREWLAEGRFPRNTGFYESMPQMAEMLFAYAAAYGGAPAAKLVHLGFLAALVALLARMAAGGRGMAAAALVAASPVVMTSAASAYNDVMLAFYAVALYCSLERGESGRAGLLAGACYAVKMTGGVFALGALLWLLFRRERPWRFVAGALVFPAPWLVRNAWLAGNPFAPFLNAWFPNEHFHASTEAMLRHNLATYGVHDLDRLTHTLFGGGVLGGHVGVGFVLAPLALWGLWRTERRAARPLVLTAVMAALPWLANAGVRFLIPALPFVALALPAPVVWPAAVAQVAALAWTPPAGSWSLRGWRARPQPGEPEVIAMLNRHTRKGERVLDFITAPRLYIHSLPMTPWGYAPADRAAAALVKAHEAAPGLMYNLRADWHTERVRQLRLVVAEPGPAPLNVQELSFEGVERCRFTATRHVTETPLAFDRNPTTGWSTWAPARAGDGITVNCPEPFESTGLRATIALAWTGMKLRVEGDGRVLNNDPGYTPEPPLNWRPAAVSAVRREGFRWILIRDGGGGYGTVAADFLARPRDWGLQRTASAGNVYLWRVP